MSLARYGGAWPDKDEKTNMVAENEPKISVFQSAPPLVLLSVCGCLCVDNVKIDVGTLSRLPEPSHNNSLSSSSSAAAADCHQSITTPGDTPGVTCSGTEAQVDVNADVNEVQSSEETGGMCIMC